MVNKTWWAKEESLGEGGDLSMQMIAGKVDTGKRLVLGFDGGCMACEELARRIEVRLGGRLEVLSLHEPRVVEWREKTLGEGTPLTPTLFEVRGQEALRAWTGWRLGANLGRFLGPVAAWEVLQVLGEVDKEPTSSRRVAGFTRGQFLKGVGGAAMAMSVLSATGKFVSAQETGEVQTVGDEVVGASISYPAEWSVEREEVTFDDTYGFTLWKRRPGSTREDIHGEVPTIRVARARRLRPEEIEGRIQARLESYSDLSVKRENVSVGQKKYKGVAVGPIPGSTPFTEVYVPVEGRVYRINVYGEELDAEGRGLLSRVKFRSPARTVESLGLPDAGEPEAFHVEEDQRLLEREKSAKAAVRSERSAEETVQRASGEAQIQEGCWKAADSYFFQTQHGLYANKRWGRAYTGWTQIGNPNYWGDYTHGNVGYGRCVSRIYTNDKFAIDYPLDKWDAVFSPFAGGTVTFAGRNNTHRDYGILVTIKADNGRYVSLSGHLSGLARGIGRGTRVSDQTIIGYAGNTGGPSFPVGKSHLHQAYYRSPSYNHDGSPYGGAALQVIYHRYAGDAAGTGPGTYRFGWNSQGLWISN